MKLIIMIIISLPVSASIFFKKENNQNITFLNNFNSVKQVRIPYRRNYYDAKYTLNRKLIKKINELEKDEIAKGIIKATPVQLRERASKYVFPILDIAEYLRLDPVYLVAVIWTESHFNKEAKSTKGANGLMQIMPRTKKYLKNKIPIKLYNDLYFLMSNYSIDHNVKENLILGSYYVKMLKERFRNTIIATAAYNMGPTWTTKRLRRKFRVGNKNEYVDKIKKRYYKIVKNL